MKPFEYDWFHPGPFLSGYNPKIRGRCSEGTKLSLSSSSQWYDIREALLRGDHGVIGAKEDLPLSVVCSWRPVLRIAPGRVGDGVM
jgi:hypothetical protein